MHERGVIHRDVKPANIVLQKRSDGTRRPVLVDLGVGRCVADVNGEEITVADRVVGTFEYMAPEQIVSSHTAGSAVDVYAVGALLYRSVAGAHPFPDKHGVELLRAKLHEPIPPLQTGRTDPIARRFEALVAQSLAYDACDRFASAADFAHALGALSEPVAPRPPRMMPERLQPLAGRRRAVVLAAISAVAFAACSVDEPAAGGTEPPPHEAETLVCR